MMNYKCFGRCSLASIDKDADPDLNAPSEPGVIPHKPLVERLESLHDGLREMFESGINLKNELTATDLITTRLTELEALQRRTVQILISTDDAFRSLMPRLDVDSNAKFPHENN